MADVKNLQAELESMLKAQNQIADLTKEFDALKIEKKYFDTYYLETYGESMVPQFLQEFDSAKLMDLWLQCQLIADENKKIGFLFKLKSFFFFGIKDTRFFNKPLKEVIPIFQKLFYQKKSIEMKEEMNRLSDKLTLFKFEKKINDLSDKSSKALKSILAKRFGKRQSRTIFDKEVLWQTPERFASEYPVILSTTHSVTSSLKDFIYDYVIVDEASQVDLATGILAMSCAKNIVVVGDTKQLPNVISENVKELVASFSEKNDIPKSYRYEENSLLSSVASVFPTAPKTMLREHYRCHPKIINFCNQKFYNNQLIIMTSDKGEEDVLKVYLTVEGNHARGKFNQRQIDEIKKHVLPELNSNDLGIIAPYNDQKDGLIKELRNRYFNCT
jgi:superfamily I DNA and/or RNA helicase